MTHPAAGIRNRRPPAFIRTPSGVALVAALALLAAALARGGGDGLDEGSGVTPTAGAARGVIDMGAPVASLDADDRFGHASALLADDPALGRREYAVAAPLSGELAPGAGRVFIIGVPGPDAAERAGADIIWAQHAARLILAAIEPGAGFGAAVLGLAGFDGHDAPALLVTAPWAKGDSDPVALGVGAAMPVPGGEQAPVAGPRSRLGAEDPKAARGRVYIFSATDGALLRTLSGRRGDTFGVMAELTDDLDADGAADILIGALFRDDSFNVRLRRQVFSARTGALLVDQEDFESPIVRLAADLNGDGVVDADDLAILLTLMGDASAPGAMRGDLNRDGVVDGLDLAMLLDSFGRTTDGIDPSFARSLDICDGGWNLQGCNEDDDCDGDDCVPGGHTGTPTGGGSGGGGPTGGPPPCSVSVSITGLPEAALCVPPPGQQLEVNLLATGSPDGGTYSWSVGPATGLEAIVNWAQLTLRVTEPGDYTVSVVYSVPNCGSNQAAGGFTVSGTYLAIHRPKVIESSETQIPRAQQITKGVQTFVNLDNDDRDDKFDLGLHDTEVKYEAAGIMEDNELVKVRLVLPGDLTQGTATLQAVAGAANILVWQASHKGEQYELGQSLTIPTDFEAEEGSLVKTLWIEGVAPHTQQQGTRLRLVVDSPQLDCPNPDEASLTVLGVEKVEWVGRGNSVNDDDSLDFDPNWPAGLMPGSVRVFPDARFSNGSVEQDARDRVGLRVTLSVKPVEPVTMHLRSFDVDDPTADASPLDDESTAEDNRGLTPAASGMFEGEGADGVKAHLFAEKEELVRFQTTMQPGDNIRVVVNGDRKFLLDLHNNDNELGGADADKQRIVNTHVFAAPGTTPEQAEVREAGKYASDVLTVWRFLHLEVDSMGPVTGNFVEGHITMLNSADSATATAVLTDISLDDGSPSPGRFEKGALTIAGTHDIQPLDQNVDTPANLGAFARAAGLNICAVPLPFTAHDVVPDPGVVDPAWTISGTVARVRDNTRLEVTIAAGVLDAGAVGGVIRIGEGEWMAIVGVTPATPEISVNALRVPFRAVDDDDSTILPRFPDTSLLGFYYAPAYILPVVDGGGNPANNDFDVEFREQGPMSTADAHALMQRQSDHQSATYWIAYIVSAYQRAPDRDADPNTETGQGGSVWGNTTNILPVVSGGRASWIYLETICDRESSTYIGPGDTPPGPADPGLEPRVVAHELGHQLVLDHFDHLPNLMQSSVHRDPGVGFLPEHYDLLWRRIESPYFP